MTKEQAYIKLHEVFREVFNRCVTLRDEMTASDVSGWDSITHLTLILHIESTFGIRFPLGKVSKMNNVGELVDTIIGMSP
jgi:acyl carrier protein